MVWVAAAAMIGNLSMPVAAQQKPASMRSIVVTLARVSLANRDLRFPNTREAGLEAGRGIAEDCKADPNGLLFASVDKRVREAVEGTAAAGGK